jgi:uncharacterized protein
MYPYRILTMDGGGVLSLLSLVLLRRIEAARPGFLDSVQLISGTSAGGINALLIAGNENPRLGLQQALNLWLTQKIYSNDPIDTLLAIAGQSSIASNETLHDYLLESIGNVTLGGLYKKVVVPSLDMDGFLRGQRTWKPKIFHNYGLNEPDRLESAVDVALRTSASPVTFPIYQGYADGGLFANNPSMCALAQALTPAQGAAEAERPGSQQDVLMLSLGAGLNEVAIEVGNPNWGWWRWLFDSQAPLALIEAVAESVPMVVDYQCATLLRERYFRLNPVLPQHVNRQFPGQQRKSLYTLGMEYPLEPVLAWIDRVDWFGTRGNAGPGTGASTAAAADDTVKPAARRAAPRKAAARTATAQQPAAQKTAAKKTAAKKTAAKKTAAPKPAAAKKTAARKSAAKKTAAPPAGEGGTARGGAAGGSDSEQT